MPWQNDPSKGSSGGPWGNKGSGGPPPPPPPPGGGGGPPDLEEFLRRGQQRLGQMMPGGFGFDNARGVILILVAAAALWMASGFYRVQPDEQGVVLTFGKWTQTTLPGLNWHWPTPIQSVLTPSVTRQNQIEIGFRPSTPPGPPGAPGRAARPTDKENLMLTGDENIVDIDFNVFWQIKDAGQYLFGVSNPEALVRIAAESALREIIGKTTILFALTEGRGRIETDTTLLLQSLLDSYGAGVSINQIQLKGVTPPVEVVDAFNEVQRARADSERSRNEAEAYRNDIIPRAKGEAQRLLQEAQGYREQVVDQAKGESKRFLSIYEAYKISPEVTAERLYLETQEAVLKDSNKIIMETNKTGTGIVPYLPLPGLQPLAPDAGAKDARTKP